MGVWRDVRGGQRAGFTVDRSGGLYQNNTFVDYIAERRRDKERTCFQGGGPTSRHLSVARGLFE